MVFFVEVQDESIQKFRQKIAITFLRELKPRLSEIALFFCSNIFFEAGKQVIFTGEFAEGKFCINGFNSNDRLAAIFLAIANLTENVEYWIDDLSVVIAEN